MKLNPDNNTGHNDYINASYVNVSTTNTCDGTLRNYCALIGTLTYV